MDYPKGESSSIPIKIRKGLDKAISQFLKTEEAELLGFRFKSDVANAAIRELLFKYGFLETLKEKSE